MIEQIDTKERHTDKIIIDNSGGGTEMKVVDQSI